MKSAIAMILLWTTMSIAMAQNESPRFIGVSCPNEIRDPASAHGADISCGLLRVTETRSASTGEQISLFVARLASLTDNDNPPIVYISGGPGDAASSDIAWWLSAKLRQDYDIIFIDQRGSGLSEPSLNCPEFDESADDNRLLRCRERLIAAGIDLAAYNTESIALDIVDLISAMDLIDVNLYGKSFGTRPALSVAKEIPNRIRSIVLDGVYPFGVSVLEDAAANTQKSMQRLFDDCRKDPACAGAYPRLQHQFEQVVADLNADPDEIELAFPGASLYFDGADFVHYLREMLADSARLPYIPALIAAFAYGEYEFLSTILSADVAASTDLVDAQSEGLYLSVFCAEEAAATSAAQIMAGDESVSLLFLPLKHSAIDQLEDCEQWGAGPVRQNMALSPLRHIPTLHLSGAYDPITPPAWGDEAAKYLANSWHYIFPDAGHGVLESDTCAEEVVLAFLSFPANEPWAACLRNLRPPEFFIRQND